MGGARIEAVLFDLDGTLIDSNRDHVLAWQRAFSDFGHEIAAQRIERQIGKGGELLVAAILGRDVAPGLAEALGEAESEHFVHIARTRRIALIPGARALLEAVHARKLRSALATSSGSEQIEAAMRSTGVDVRALVDVTIGADEVERAKPHPDPLLAAAQALAIEPARCVMVGDTLYDARAAEIAGMPAFGVATWVWSTGELIEAGARAAWESPAGLQGELDRALDALTAPRRAREAQRASPSAETRG